MTRRRWSGDGDPLRMDVDVAAMLTILRAWLGLPLDRPVPGERAAVRGRALVPVAEQVDVGAWFAWSVVGLCLFSSVSEPGLREAEGEARRLLLALAMEREGGNITHVADRVRTSRRAARERLKEYGLYALGDWDGGIEKARVLAHDTVEQPDDHEHRGDR